MQFYYNLTFLVKTPGVLEIFKPPIFKRAQRLVLLVLWPEWCAAYSQNGILFKKDEILMVKRAVISDQLFLKCKFISLQFSVHFNSMC